MILVTDLAKYCEQFQKGEIEPRRKELGTYLKREYNK